MADWHRAACSIFQQINWAKSHSDCSVMVAPETLSFVSLLLWQCWAWCVGREREREEYRRRDRSRSDEVRRSKDGDRSRDYDRDRDRVRSSRDSDRDRRERSRDRDKRRDREDRHSSKRFDFTPLLCNHTEIRGSCSQGILRSRGKIRRSG